MNVPASNNNDYNRGDIPGITTSSSEELLSDDDDSQFETPVIGQSDSINASPSPPHRARICGGTLRPRGPGTRQRAGNVSTFFGAIAKSYTSSSCTSSTITSQQNILVNRTV